MPIDPMKMRVDVVKKEFMENAARMYKESGFMVEEWELLGPSFQVM
jgi:hypothetical protein